MKLWSLLCIGMVLLVIISINSHWTVLEIIFSTIMLMEAILLIGRRPLNNAGFKWNMSCAPRDFSHGISEDAIVIVKSIHGNPPFITEVNMDSSKGKWIAKSGGELVNVVGYIFIHELITNYRKEEK